MKAFTLWTALVHRYYDLPKIMKRNPLFNDPVWNYVARVDGVLPVVNHNPWQYSNGVEFQTPEGVMVAIRSMKDGEGFSVTSRKECDEIDKNYFSCVGKTLVAEAEAGIGIQHFAFLNKTFITIAETIAEFGPGWTENRNFIGYEIT